MKKKDDERKGNQKRRQQEGKVKGRKDADRKVARGKFNQKEKEQEGERPRRRVHLCTDMIFVKFFTQAHFPNFRNLPPKNA